MSQTETQSVWTKERLLKALDTSQKNVVAALGVLLARQTADEQTLLQTKHSNGRGFNSRDAAVLTDIAKRLPRYGNRLTDRQVILVRGRIGKYWRQLLEHIESKGAVVSYADTPRPKATREPTTQNSPTTFGSWG